MEHPGRSGMSRGFDSLPSNKHGSLAPAVGRTLAEDRNKEDHANKETRVKNIDGELERLGKKIKNNWQEKTDLIRAESVALDLYSTIIGFSEWARKLSSESEEYVSKLVREQLGKKPSRHKKMLIGQLSSSKIDQRFYPDSPVDWVRMRYFMNTIEVEQIEMFDPITRNRIRAVNRQFLLTQKQADPKIDNIERLLEMTISGNKSSRHFWLLLDAFEMGIFTFEDAHRILEAFKSQNIFTLLSPKQKNDKEAVRSPTNFETAKPQGKQELAEVLKISQETPQREPIDLSTPEITHEGVKMYLRLLIHIILLHNDCVFENKRNDGTSKTIPIKERLYFFQSHDCMVLLKQVLLDPLIENRYALVKDLEDLECKHLYYRLFLMLMSYHHDPMVKSIQTLQTPGFSLVPPQIYARITTSQATADASEKDLAPALNHEPEQLARQSLPELDLQRSKGFYLGRYLVRLLKQEFKSILEGNYSQARNTPIKPTDYAISDRYRPSPKPGSVDEGRSLDRSIESGGSPEGQENEFMLRQITNLLMKAEEYLQPGRTSVKDFFLESLSHHGFGHVLVLFCSFLTSEWSSQGFKERIKQCLEILGKFYDLYLPARGHLFAFDKWDNFRRVSRFAQVDSMCVLIRVVRGYQPILRGSEIMPNLMAFLKTTFSDILNSLGNLRDDLTNISKEKPYYQNPKSEHPRVEKIATLNLILTIFDILIDSDIKSSTDQFGLIKKLAIEIQFVVIKEIENLVLPILSNPSFQRLLQDFSHPILYSDIEALLKIYQNKYNLEYNEFQESWALVFCLLRTFNNTCKHSTVDLKGFGLKYGVGVDLDKVKIYISSGINIWKGAQPSAAEPNIFQNLLTKTQSVAVAEAPAAPGFLQSFSGLMGYLTGPFFLTELVQLYSHYNIANISGLTEGLELPIKAVIDNLYRLSSEVLAGVLAIHKDYAERFQVDDTFRSEATDMRGLVGKKALCYLLYRGQLQPLYKFIKGASLHHNVEQLKTSTIIWQVCKVFNESIESSPLHREHLKEYRNAVERAAKADVQAFEQKILKSASSYLMNLGGSDKDKSEDASSSLRGSDSQLRSRLHEQMNRSRNSVFQRLRVRTTLVRTFDDSENDMLLLHIEEILDRLLEASQAVYSLKLLDLKDPVDVYCYFQKDTYLDHRSQPPRNWSELRTEGSWNLQDLKKTIDQTLERYYTEESSQEQESDLRESEEVKQNLKYPVERMALSYLSTKKAQIDRSNFDKKKDSRFMSQDTMSPEDQTKKHQSVYLELSESTEENPQAYFLVIAYWVMKDLYTFLGQTSSKKLNSGKAKELVPGVPASIPNQDILIMQPHLVGMLELFDNILIIGGHNIRKLVHDMFFEVDEDDEIELNEEKQASKQEYHPQNIGRGGLKFVLQICLSLQRTIIKETFDVHELMHAGLYFRLCFFLKSLVEENFVKMKAIIKSLHMEESGPSSRKSKNLLEAFMEGIMLPNPSEQVSVVSFQHFDRPDLVWYNYITVVTLSECVFGLRDPVKVTSDQIIRLLKQLNTICIDVNNPTVLLKERLAVLIGFLFEGTTNLLVELYKTDGIDEMIKPRVMFDQIVNLISLLLFSRDEIKPESEPEEQKLESNTLDSVYSAFQAVTDFSADNQALLNEEFYQIDICGKLAISNRNNNPKTEDESPSRTEYNFMLTEWVSYKQLLRKVKNMRAFNSAAVEKEFSVFKLMEEFSSPKEILSECYIPRPEIAQNRLLSTARMVYSIMKLISKSNTSREFKVFLTSTEYNVAKASGDTATLNLYQSNPSLMQDFKVFRSSQESRATDKERAICSADGICYSTRDWNLETVVFGFLKLVSGSVEVRTEEGGNTLVDFPILPCCFFISEQTKLGFTESVTIGDHGGRLVDMMESVSHFEIEAKLNMSIHQTSPVLERIVSLDSFKIMLWVSWIVSLGLNIIALIYLDFSKYTDTSYSFEEEWAWTILNIGNIALIVYSLFMASIYLIVRSTENYQKRTKKIFEVIRVSRYSSIKKFALYVWEILKDVLMNQDVIVFCFCNILFSALFLLDSSYFLPFHMLLFASLSKTAKYIIRSITLHVDQLLFTLLLVMIVVYSYTMLIGLYYQSSFDPNATNNIQVCNNLLNCYCYVLDLGLRNGGGVGDSMVNVEFGTGFFYGKFFMTVTFFIFINLVSLNIIFGIIIDTFAELRKELEEREDEDYRACFICGIERKDFEKKDKSFDYHKAVEHNLWNYVYFIVYLNHLERLDMTGVESHVFNKLESKSPEWIPRNGTVFLDLGSDQTESPIDTVVEQVVKKVESIKKSAATLEKALQKLIRTQTEKGQVGESLPQSPAKGGEESQPAFEVVLSKTVTELRSLIQGKVTSAKQKLAASDTKKKELEGQVSVSIGELLKEKDPKPPK